MTGRSRRRASELRGFRNGLRLGRVPPEHEHRLRADGICRVVGGRDRREFEHMRDQLGGFALALHHPRELADVREQPPPQRLDRSTLRVGEVAELADRAERRAVPGDVAARIDLRAAQQLRVLPPQPVAEDRRELVVHVHHRLPVHLHAADFEPRCALRPALRAGAQRARPAPGTRRRWSRA